MATKVANVLIKILLSKKDYFAKNIYLSNYAFNK